MKTRGATRVELDLVEAAWRIHDLARNHEPRVSLTDLAAKAEVSPTSFNNWKFGDEPAKVQKLERFANELGAVVRVVVYDSSAEDNNGGEQMQDHLSRFAALLRTVPEDQREVAVGAAYIAARDAIRDVLSHPHAAVADQSEASRGRSSKS